MIEQFQTKDISLNKQYKIFLVEVMYADERFNRLGTVKLNNLFE